MSDVFHTEQREGFEIELSFEHEDMHPRECFDPSVTDIDELVSKIESGEYVWVMVCVRALKNGIQLSSEYLGGVCYEASKLKDFLTDGYYKDMVSSAIIQAKHAILSLSEG